MEKISFMLYKNKKEHENRIRFKEKYGDKRDRCNGLLYTKPIKKTSNRKMLLLEGGACT